MIKKFFLIIFLICVALVGGFVTLHNAHQMTLDLYFTSITLPFVVFLLITLFIGGLLGVSMTYWMVLKQRLAIRRLERAKKTLNKELDTLRNQPTQVLEPADAQSGNQTATDVSSS